MEKGEQQRGRRLSARTKRELRFMAVGTVPRRSGQQQRSDAKAQRGTGGQNDRFVGQQQRRVEACLGDIKSF